MLTTFNLLHPVVEICFKYNQDKDDVNDFYDYYPRVVHCALDVWISSEKYWERVYRVRLPANAIITVE